MLFFCIHFSTFKSRRSSVAHLTSYKLACLGRIERLNTWGLYLPLGCSGGMDPPTPGAAGLLRVGILGGSIFQCAGILKLAGAIDPKSRLMPDSINMTIYLLRSSNVMRNLSICVGKCDICYRFLFFDFQT